MRSDEFRRGSRAWRRALYGAAVVGATVAPPAFAEDADLVLRGGRVATVNKADDMASAVAVRGHEIVAVGSDEEIESYLGDSTEVIDLEGRLLIPGFIEGHGHFMGLGMAKLRLDLTKAKTWDDIVAMVAEAAKAAEPGEWILGRGWHQEKWSETPDPNVDGVPLNDSLSAVSPDNPCCSLTRADTRPSPTTGPSRWRESGRTRRTRRAEHSCGMPTVKRPGCSARPRSGS